MVRVRVACHERVDAERLGEVAERGVATRVTPLVRPLELDEEAVSSEGARKAGCRVRIPHGEAVPRAAGQADETFGELLEERLVEGRLAQLRFAPRRTRVRVSGGQQATEVRVALWRLDEQRDVRARPRAVGERDLRTRDRPNAERLGRVGELERAVDAVVIGQSERLVAELGGACSELLRLRGAVEERIG